MLTLAHGLEDGSKVEEGEEHDVAFVEAGEDAAESLEPVEESFDLVAAALEHAVVFPRLQTGALGRHDGNPSAIQCQLACLVVLSQARSISSGSGSGRGPRPASSSRPRRASRAWPGEREKVIAVRAFAATR